MSNIEWEAWQLKLMDDYILGYAQYNNQEQLAEELGKSLNAVKIKITRRRKELDGTKDMLNIRQLSLEEYKLFLSNRFDKTTSDIAKLLNITESFLLNELDEIDSLEAVEQMSDGFSMRVMSLDEIILLNKLHKKGYNSFQIAHILNRPIKKIEEVLE